ncbi:MAG TPA: hypothetical protein VLT45_18480 [Kofleriaceae bacterium]|nr:hypothetical protein [Kofleriaceae bacterium]
MRTATLAALFALGISAPARAESNLWAEMANRLDTLHHDAVYQQGKGIRMMYLHTALSDCSRLAALRASEPQVAPGLVAAAREYCLVAVQTYVQGCVDQVPPSTCPDADPAKLRDSIAALAPLSPAEKLLLARVPDPFWTALQRDTSSYTAADPRHAVEACIEAPRHPAPEHLREVGRDFCATTATKYAAACLRPTGLARECTADWDLDWPHARDAAQQLAPLSAEQAAAFDHIINSPALADLRLDRDFNTILTDADAQHADRCATLTKLRGLLGPPDASLETRASATEGTTDTRAHSRLSTYLYLVRQMYMEASRQLERPVEDQDVAGAKHAVNALTCIRDYRDSATLLERATTNVAAVEQYQAKEAACMATPSCKAKRIAAQICSAIDARRQVQKDIAQEWSYARQAGVVSLHRLGEDKDGLETLDDEIATAKEQYAALTKHSFSPSSCSATTRTKRSSQR